MAPGRMPDDRRCQPPQIRVRALPAKGGLHVLWRPGPAATAPQAPIFDVQGGDPASGEIDGHRLHAVPLVLLEPEPAVDQDRQPGWDGVGHPEVCHVVRVRAVAQCQHRRRSSVGQVPQSVSVAGKSPPVDGSHTYIGQR